MTPVALWTGRLPGLCPLPRKRTLWAVGLLMVLGAAGAYGAFGPNGPYLAAAASLAAGWAVWRHRWPTRLPLRLRSLESPQGPDERAVMVEIRHEGDLLGWDVGILWFEKGGVGFVGRTVSFVLPRASMQFADAPHTLQTLLRAPQMSAKVFETTVGIVPLGEELKSQMTLARIDALPNHEATETILPPRTMHPDLLRRGLTLRRRLPFIAATMVINFALTFPPLWLSPVPAGLSRNVAVFIGFSVIVYTLYGRPLPLSIRDRLPEA